MGLSGNSLENLSELTEYIEMECGCEHLASRVPLLICTEHSRMSSEFTEFT